MAVSSDIPLRFLFIIILLFLNLQEQYTQTDIKQPNDFKANKWQENKG
jgi:hypothetical protein